MRYQRYLRERYRALLGYSGGLLMTLGIVFLLPLPTLLFYPQESALAGAFWVPGAVLMIFGYVLWHWLTPEEPLSLSLQEGAVVVVFVWMAASVVGALPFMIALRLDFTQALFESTSGWTTTGMSVVDVTEAPRIMLFYRSMIQFIGGAGFVIIALSAVAGPLGTSLTAAEGRTEQLAPHVRQSASIVVRIYLSYAVLGILALRLAGMGWFDAINHAFTAVATGGFSTQPDSIGHWDNASIEIIIVILMLLGHLNFLTAYTLIKRKFRAVLLNGEVRLAALLMGISFLMLAWVAAQVYGGADKTVRVALFEAASALSGTGFSTVNYGSWNQLGWLVLIGLMVVGGGSGSTAGGIKQIRIYVLYKSLIWEVRRTFMPRHMVNEPAIWHGEQRGFLNDRMVRQVALFTFLYMVLLVVGTGIVAAHGHTLSESLFEFASSLGTVGLSVGLTVPDSPPTLLWTQIIGMFMGRLEMFAVIMGVSKLLADARTLLQGAV